MSELKTDGYKSREGFSLVELIITIAIMVVMVGGAALSIGLLRSADTQGLASGINGSLTDLKAYTESQKGPIYLYIYKVNGEGYYAHYSFPDEHGVNHLDPASFSSGSAFTAVYGDGDQKLGSDALDVKVAYDDGSGGVTMEDITGANYTVIRIQKKDGSYLDVANESGTFTKTVPKWIGVYKSGETDPDYKVVLAKGTGLHFSEQQ